MLEPIHHFRGRARKRLAVVAATVGVMMLVGPIVSTAGASNANKSNRQPIIVGVVATLTGSHAATFYPRYQAIVATVAWENAHGGVNGHQIKLVTQDDGGSITANLTAVQSLVQNDGAFMILEASQGQDGGATWLSQTGIPTIFTSGSTNASTEATIFYAYGGQNPDASLGNTGNVKFLKSLPGVHSIGGLANSNCAACQLAATTQVNSAALVGLQKGYLNLTVPAGETNWTPYVLGLQNTNTNAVVLVLSATDNLNFIAAEEQQGLHLKILATALYNGSFLTGPTAPLMQGVYVNSPTNPDPNSPPVKTMLAILRKYGDGANTHPFSANEAQGYMAALLVFEALKVGGVNPTRNKVIYNLAKVTNWPAGGMLAYKVNFALEHTTAAPITGGPCAWYLEAEGTQFKILTKKAVCTPTVRLLNS